MESTTIIIISVITLIICLLIQKIIFQNKILSEIKLRNDKITEEFKQLKQKYEALILEQFDIQNRAYKNGLSEGESKNKLTVRIEPIENYSGNNYYLWSTEKVEIGFVYTLLINGNATEYKSTHIIKSVKASKVNQENINTILNGLEKIENLNPKIFIVSKSFQLIKENFLKHIKN